MFNLMLVYVYSFCYQIHVCNTLWCCFARLDAQLLHFCLKDATEKCNLKLEPGSTNVEPGPTVFSCLYKRMKYATEPSEKVIITFFNNYHLKQIK